MSNIAKRSDGRWRARYRDGQGREHARHFTRKVDAQQWLDSVTTSVRIGTYVDPGLSKVTVGQWAARWLPTKVNLKASTLATYTALLGKHVLPTWQNLKLADVTHEAVSAWVAGLSGAGLAPSTVRQSHRVLSLMLELAVRDGRLPRNPAAGVALPRNRKRDQVFLTHSQVDALAAAAGRDRLTVLFLAYTGVRFGEMAGLRVRNLNLVRRRAHIMEAVSEVGGRLIVDTPKNHLNRSVPIPRFLVDELARHVAGKGPDEHVFTSPKGTVLRNRNWRGSAFDRAVRESGLSGLTPHSLRHTAASLAIAAGANVKVVQQMLGHASATMTMDLYGHLFGDQLDEVADAMDAARTAADFLRTNDATILKLQSPRISGIQ